MKKSFRSLIVATAVASIAASAGTASAAITKADAKCHQTIAKNIGKYQQTLAKNIAGCHKLRDAGKPGTTAMTDCNNAVGSDLKLKRTGARAKIVAGIQKVCDGGLAPGAMALYVSCPSPAAGPITNGSQLANCLMDLSEDYSEKMGDALIGLPATLPLSAATQKTRGALTKAYAGYVKAVTGERASCQKTAEKTLVTGDYLPACTTVDSKGKIAKALTALDTAINGLAADLPNPAAYVDWGVCADRLKAPTIALFKACALDKIVKPITNGMAGAAQELPGTCAAVADITINAATATVAQNPAAKIANTRLDSGYLGLGHDVDVVDASRGGVKLENCDADCTDCDVRIDATRGGYCRCMDDPTVKCSEIGGVDAACPMGVNGQVCQCMFGPPLPLSAAGVPVCVVNRFAGDFTGSTQEVGEYDVGTTTRALVHNGIKVTQPCPICVGDASPNSGNSAGGTCSGGPRNGLACDENAEHPDFGPTSFDCPPDPLGNQTGTGLRLALRFTSGSVSFTAAVSGANSQPGSVSHCSQCTGDDKVGCSSNADCTGIGTCGQNLGADNPKQNGCDGGDSDCIANIPADGMGSCSSGPYDLYCDGALRKSGKGIITCQNDADCDTYNAGCQGNDCGNCTIPGERSCFLPTISGTGTPGIFNSEGVSAFCSAKTSSSNINSAAGLPGPGRVKLDFDFDLFCSDHTTKFELPSGSNCP